MWLIGVVNECWTRVLLYECEDYLLDIADEIRGGWLGGI